MKIDLAFVFILLGCLLISCKKDSVIIPKPTRSIPVSAAIKEWGYFKEGSYWIVKDSINNTTDSIYVISVNSIQKTYDTQDTTFSAEETTIEFSSAAFFKQIILSSFRSDHIDMLNFYTNPELLIFKTDTTLLNTFGSGINKNQNVSNFSIYNNNYGNVRFIYYSYEFEAPSTPQVFYKDYLYWKKNVGIIKRGILPGFANYDAFEVLRYHVIQS